MAEVVPKYVSLPGGIQMPVLGLGTYMPEGPSDVRLAVETALDCGYRHIDTAYSYGNEAEIGDVLARRFADGRLKREHIFVTTKIAGTYTRSREAVRTGFFDSLNKLKLDYLDLYLMHSPLGLRAMEELVDEGRVRAIGLSNFNSKQLDKIHQVARIPIATNQVECHIYLQQDRLLEFCRERNITLTAYAPFGSPGLWSEGCKVLGDPTVRTIATKHNRTSAQVLLRWLIQRGIIVIPKSVTPSRIQENIKVFDFSLDDGDMKSLRSLDRNQRFFTMENIGAVNHPDYPFDEPF